jgi:hypothetical protein
MAIKDFVVKNGLQVSSNVGIGTSTVVAGTRVMVRDGNINISTNGFGVLFPDGSFQTTALSGGTAVGGTGALQYANGTAFAGNNTKLYFDSANSRVGIGTSDTANATLNVKGTVPTLLSTLSGSDYQVIVGNTTSYGSTVGWSTSNYGYLQLVGGTQAITWNNTGVGIKGVTAVNALDVSGAAVIGSGIAYAGAATAPSNGLLVQGRVGIGTTTAGHPLDVTGNINSTNTVFAVHFDNVSDASLKDNVTAIKNPMKIIDKLKPVSFNWKESGQLSYGLIAQEVEDILPSIVHTKTDGLKTVNYIEIIAILLQAVKEQQKQINKLIKKA